MTQERYPIEIFFPITRHYFTDSASYLEMSIDKREGATLTAVSGSTGYTSPEQVIEVLSSRNGAPRRSYLNRDKLVIEYDWSTNYFHRPIGTAKNVVITKAYAMSATAYLTADEISSRTSIKISVETTWAAHYSDPVGDNTLVCATTSIKDASEAMSARILEVGDGWSHDLAELCRRDAECKPLPYLPNYYFTDKSGNNRRILQSQIKLPKLGPLEILSRMS